MVRRRSARSTLASAVAALLQETYAGARGHRFVRGVRRLPCACQRRRASRRELRRARRLVHLVCGPSGGGATVLEYGWS